MEKIRELDDALNKLISEGKILEAFDRYYAEDVVMQENTEPPTVGKAANRAREEKFVGSVEQVHEIKLLTRGEGEGGVTFSVWAMDVTYKGGNRVRSEQAAVRHWKDGLVVREQFFHA